MPEVRVTATGALRACLGDGITVAAGQTVQEAMEGLQLDTDSGLVCIPVVNGRVVEWHHRLEPGDELQLTLIIAGG
jgi:sulfur carrier protein ThiS